MDARIRNSQRSNCDATTISKLATSRKILTLGSSGAGKTWFSVRLGELLGVPTIHLDAHFWSPGWMPTPEDEWRRKISELAKKSSWIMDGTYENTLDLRIPAADFIIILDAPRWLCLASAWKRIHSEKARIDAPPNQPFNREFLRYIWEYPTVTRPLVDSLMQAYGNSKNHIRLNGRHQALRCLALIRSYLLHEKNALHREIAWEESEAIEGL